MAGIERITLGNVIEAARGENLGAAQTAAAISGWRDKTAAWLATQNLPADQYFKGVEALDAQTAPVLQEAQQAAVAQWSETELPKILPNPEHRELWAISVAQNPPHPDEASTYAWPGGMDPEAAVQAWEAFGKVSTAPEFRPKKAADWQILTSNDGAALARWRPWKSESGTEIELELPGAGFHRLDLPQVTENDVTAARAKANADYTDLHREWQASKDLGPSLFGGRRDPEELSRSLDDIGKRLDLLKGPSAQGLLTQERMVQSLKDSPLAEQVGKKDFLEDIGKGLWSGLVNIRTGFNDLTGDTEERDALRRYNADFRRRYPGSTNREFQGGFSDTLRQAAEGFGGMAPTVVPGTAAARVPKLAGTIAGRVLSLAPLAVQSYGGNLDQMLTDADNEEQAGNVARAKMLRDNAHTAAVLQVLSDVSTEMIFPEERLANAAARGGRIARGVKGVVSTGAQNFAEESTAAALQGLTNPSLQGRPGPPVLESGVIGALSAAPLGVTSALGRNPAQRVPQTVPQGTVAPLPPKSTSTPLPGANEGQAPAAAVPGVGVQGTAVSGGVTRLGALSSGGFQPPASPTGGQDAPPTFSPDARFQGAAEPSNSSREVDIASPDALALPPAAPGVPPSSIVDPPLSIAAQAQQAADKSSPQRAVLIPPGTPMPPKTPGLKAFQGESPHGVILYNPKKVTPAEVRAVAMLPTFDGTTLGIPGTAPLQGAPPTQAPRVEPLTPRQPPVSDVLMSKAEGAAQQDSDSQGGSSDADYRIAHRPMQDAGGAARLHDLLPAFGEDIYTKNALQYFGSGDPRESKIVRILRGLRGKPDAAVMIYRGVPKDAPDMIAAGDWITLLPEIAEDYASQQGGKVISKEARARDITSWADSLAEFGYFPASEASPAPVTGAVSSKALPAGSKRGVSAKAAADAIAILRSNAPELLQNLRIVESPADLNPNDYHPDDWQSIASGTPEGFYQPKTGQTTIILSNIGQRPGESPIGAVARVIMHERIAHAGLALLRSADKSFPAKWAALTNEIPPEELAALLPLYPELAEQPDRLAEEWFARHGAEKAQLSPPASVLRRMWEAIKAAVQKLWRGFATPKGMTLDQRVQELVAASRNALRSGGFQPPANNTRGQDAPATMLSRNPYEPRDWQSVPLPQWLRDRMGARAVSAYEVQSQGARAILTGSVLPREFAAIVADTQDEIRAIQARGAAIGRDLQAAMTGFAKRSGQTPQQVATLVNSALEDPLLMGALTDPVLRTRATAARNFIDTLSHEVAATTGGVLGQTILQNAGHWLRRGYAVFDKSANWNKQSLTAAAAAGKLIGGRDARTILNDARAYLTAQHPGLTPAGIDAMMSDLLDRDQWQSASLGIPRADGARVSRETSSFMKRKEIAPQIRALLGEETNPIKRLARSLGIQAQLIARFDQQRAMRDLGLRMGIFSTTADGTYHKPVGGDDVHGNMRWNGFAWTDPATGKVQPVYTTPEMLEALNNAAAMDGRDLGGIMLRAYKALGAEAKMNKVALNPDSWAVNVLGNVLGLIQSGDVFHFAGWQRVAEAVRIHRSAGAHSGDAINAVAEAMAEARRAVLGRLTAAGVAGASFEIRDLEASLDNSVLAFIEGNDVANRAAGVARGAVLGQAFGKVAGTPGRVVGAAAGAIGGAIAGGKNITAVQKKIAQAVLSTPDNIGKIAVYLGNYASLLSSGMTADAAHTLAAEKTRNTMPDYSKLPALLREFSKLGLLGSFIAFQFEVYRNYYHNIRYAAQELRSGNPALIARGLRRMMGAATVTALGGGVLSMIAGAFGGGTDDDKDAAYRRSLGAPWERFGELAYTHFDKESASFFNTSYIVPQTTLFEIARAAREGKNFGESLTNALNAARRQFASGSVHADPVLEAIMNTRMGDKGPVTYEEGWRAFRDRLQHVLTVSLEPGAANKSERVAKALRGEENRGRKFSTDEELARMVGIRQSTYTHEQRIRGRLYEFRDAYQNARASARKEWKDSPLDRAAALQRANDRIAAVEQRWHEFQTDMKTLGIPASKVESIRRDVGLGAQFHLLRPGQDGPESVP